MNVSLLLIPFLSPLFAAIFCLFFWSKPKKQRWIYFFGSSIMLSSAFVLLSDVYRNGILHIEVGSWKAPFGIVLVADLLSCIMIIVAALSGFVIFFFSLQAMDKSRVRYGYYSVMLFLQFGLCGAFLAGDVFNLYVWFEVMLVSSFVLMTLGGTKDQLEGSIKYVMLNFLASSLLLAGIGILYGVTGTLNMAYLAVKVQQVQDPALITLAAMFFFIGFGIKSAVFPLYYWLPAAYPTPPIGVIAMIGGLMSKVGVYTMMRFFTLIFDHDTDYTHQLMIIIAALTMISGGLGAIAQNDFRKILAFSIISQIGYMIMGIGFNSVLALSGVIFFIIHSVLVKTNLFLISGIVNNIHGTFRLKELGDVYSKFPLVALMFAISAFSMTGIPPLSGFWGKLALVKAGMEAQEYLITGIALVVSLFTLFYSTKIWNHVFWKKAPDSAPPAIIRTQTELFRKSPMLVTPAIFMTAVILLLSLYAQPVINITQKAATQLVNKEQYIKTVLGSNY
jgi:multicomponent Na+:H+ antiporter subunit D